MEFVASYGSQPLRVLEVEDPVWGARDRRHLEQAWDRFVAVREVREVRALAEGRRSTLGHVDPLRSLNRPQRQIAGGES
jgi:hypothetical protein